MNQNDRQTRKSSAGQARSDLPPKLFPNSSYPDKKQQASKGGKKRGVIVAPTPEAGRD
jgi:hypothetical protein